MVWFAAKLQMVLRWGGGERKHFGLTNKFKNTKFLTTPAKFLGSVSAPTLAY